MRQSVALRGAAALFSSFIGAREVRAQEEAVPHNEIPKAVTDALLAKFPQARIEKCSRAKEGDDIVYDIEFTQAGRKCEADITEKGGYVKEWREEKPVAHRNA